jgi:hypothetical protein
MHSIHRLLAAALLLVGACRWDDHDVDPGDDEIDAAVEIDADLPDADPALPDAPPPPDAAPLSATISCGASDCPRDSEICCYTNYPNITQACSAADQCMNVIAECDGPEDCDNGDVCCVETSGATCKPDGMCTGATTGKACHTNADCPKSNNCHKIQFVPWPIC